ncbi:uncharacterized protein LOC113231765 isoform X1 [Hyposmocoma kahamanoa]|uniref:uncharacterized protein LOC113231765 isoform X1 n=1 Tax=Hyposmocoma kahamanoa TaxID=1477025 RepID=UPI000E6D859E|nr:uncharacterized protein LOC113231765 isoform X1 [Hyposmocoma kahamanoa]
MSKFSNYFILFVCFLLATFSTVNSISCYQCSGTDSDNPFECTEWLGNDIDLKPTDCGAIHNAQFCIKHVGRFEGGISTKRFCSSLDLGNYCNYVQQPGDKLEYRSCIYTCSTDSCNAASSLQMSVILLTLIYFFKLIL